MAGHSEPPCRGGHDAQSGHDLTRNAGHEALHVLEQRKITSIVVVDAANLVQGVVHLHDLWRTQMF